MSGGIYDGPDGQKLHGDGKSVGRPHRQTMTPSHEQLVNDLAEKHAAMIINYRHSTVLGGVQAALTELLTRVGQVQLDAYKAGMTEAAEIANKEESKRSGIDESHLTFMAKLILTARDNKTTL